MYCVAKPSKKAAGDANAEGGLQRGEGREGLSGCKEGKERDREREGGIRRD